MDHSDGPLLPTDSKFTDGAFKSKFSTVLPSKVGTHNAIIYNLPTNISFQTA